MDRTTSAAMTLPDKSEPVRARDGGPLARRLGPDRPSARPGR